MDEYKEEEKKSEKQVVEKVTKLLSSYEQATEDVRKEFTDIYNVYMGKMDSVQDTPYETKESLPKLRTEIAYVKPFVFSGEPEIEIEGVGEEDKDMAKIFEQMVNYRIQQSIPNAYEKIESWVHQSVTFGTSLMKVIWRFNTEEVTEGEQTYEQVTMDEPDLDVPNILDVYYNPLIADVKDQPCLIFRSVLPLEEVKENPMYDFVGEDGKLNREKLEAQSNEQNTKNSSALSGIDLASGQKKATEGMVEIYELVDDDEILTIANGKALRQTPNKYGFINAVKLNHEPNTIPNRFNGMGVGQNTIGLGRLHYKMWNQTVTNVKLGNNPMFLFKEGTNVDPKQLVAKPAGGIKVKGEGSLGDLIQPLLFPDVKEGAIQILSKLDDEHKRASGANDLVQGGTSNDTLGQDEIAQANTSNRFELIQRRFKHALADVAEMILKMELENLQSVEAPILRIFPQEMREAIYQVIVQEGKNIKYNIKIKGETNVAKNKNLEAKRQVDMFNLMQNFLTDKEKRAFGRRILELQGIPNIDELIAEENPIMEQQQAMAMGQAPQPQMVGAETQAGLAQQV